MMQFNRLLLISTVAFCAAAFDASSKDAPCSDSTQSCMPEAAKEAENGLGLAQRSFSMGKVGLYSDRPQQGSLGTMVSLILAALLVLSVFFAYGGVPQVSEATAIAFEQPRRLSQGVTQIVFGDVAAKKALKSNREAARRTIAGLRLRGARHRLVRLDEGDDGVLDDDRDSAKVAGLMSKAKAYSQRQQYEKANKLFKSAAHMARDHLRDLQKDHAGPVEIEEATQQASDVYLQSATFFLERGRTKSAKKMLKRSLKIIGESTNSIAMRTRLLVANAHRDAGEFDDAVASYADLLARITKQQHEASSSERAMLYELRVETHGEFARALLSQDKAVDARKHLEDALEKLQASEASEPQVSGAVLIARLKGWLGAAYVKEGKPAKAVDLLDASLAGLGEIPAGLAGATTEVQEILQSRAAAKAALGRLHNAAEDLEVVRGLQDELMQTVANAHNPKYAAGEGKVPDPHLWASMARTMCIAADLKLQAKVGAEALPLARKALHLLREVKQSIGRVPKGSSLATFAEVKDLIAKAKLQQSKTAGDKHHNEDGVESEASLDDTDMSHPESEVSDDNTEDPAATRKETTSAIKEAPPAAAQAPNVAQPGTGPMANP